MPGAAFPEPSRGGDAGTLTFEGTVIAWRGPAPYVFVPVPDELSRDIRMIAKEISYGWGVIPVRARIGETEWRTSIMPRDGRYLVPLKMKIQHDAGIAVGDQVTLTLLFG